jgi:mannose-1-phosphate guanylyltransferase
MVPVLNRPFMEHTIAFLKQAGIEDIILTLSYLPGVIQDYFGDGRRFGVHLTYCVEKEPMGTAGAVKNAEEYLDSTFLVLNGDIFTDLDIAGMLASHRNKSAKATISLSWVDNPSAFGVIETGADQRVERFVEKPPPGEATTNWVNAGTYILEPEVLKYIPTGSHYMFERGLFPRLLERGEPVYGYPFSGYWLDMGTPAKYLSLNCDLLLSRTSSPLIHGDGVLCEPGVTIHPSAEVTAPVIIGPDSRVGRGVRIRGPVVIGPACYLEEGASLEKAVLWNNVRLGANSRLERCIVSRQTVIAPDKQIMDGVVMPSRTAPLPR